MVGSIWKADFFNLGVNVFHDTLVCIFHNHHLCNLHLKTMNVSFTIINSIIIPGLPRNL